MIEISKIEPNSFNPNVMGKEEYEALKQDMHVHGSNGVDPILVSPKGVFYCQTEITSKCFEEKGWVIVDGEHRWRIAKELGWKEIRCETENIREDDAKALCYRRNRERGTIDPMKEALLFKSDLPKLTQAMIAGKYGVDQSTVSHRLSLLKLDQAVLETVAKLPRGIISTSHLEPIATLEPDDQRKIAQNMIHRIKHFGEQVSVRDVQNEAERLRKDREEKKLLAEAVQKAKFAKCPVCGKEPGDIHYKKLPWVNCSSDHYDHAWSLVSGKLVNVPERASQNTVDGESKPIPPKTLRSVHTVEEISRVFIERIKEVIAKEPTLKIKKIDVDGELQGKNFGFDINTYGQSVGISWHHGATWRGFRCEKHDYKSGEKSAVVTGSPNELEEVEQLIENAFMGKLGIELKRPKKKTGSEIVHELHTGNLEANHIQLAQSPEESLAAAEARSEEEV